jgi:hypothetical protein
MLLISMIFLAACAPADLNHAIPQMDTGVDPASWAQIPAGEFFFGQFNTVETTPAYEMMITNVTTAQYAVFLNEALAAGSVKVEGNQVVGYYPGDAFRGVKHEANRSRGLDLYPLILLNGSGSMARLSASIPDTKPPMTMVSWFGARGIRFLDIACRRNRMGESRAQDRYPAISLGRRNAARRPILCQSRSI